MSEEKTAVYNCTDTDTEAASGYGHFFSTGPGMSDAIAGEVFVSIFVQVISCLKYQTVHEASSSQNSIKQQTVHHTLI